MLNSIFSRIFPAAALLLASVTASAQLITSPSGHMPASHELSHQDLLASQAPLMDQLRLDNTQRFIQEMEEREAMDDDEIFSAFWDDSSVNPYGKALIPDHKVINVEDYVHPLARTRVTSEFGYRRSFGRMHKGIDLGLNVGDTVGSCFSGVVRIAKYNPGGYGNYVVVRHDNGLETVYGHLKRATVKPGQRVKAGEMIGLGGNTGRSTGPHLHLETRYMGIAINPREIIDFENETTHRDTYAFDRSKSEKAVKYSPQRRSTKAKYASKSRSYKKKTSARRSTRAKASSSRKRRR